jgi:hypothetical protein
MEEGKKLGARVWGRRAARFKSRGEGEREVDRRQRLGFGAPTRGRRHGTITPAAQPASKQAWERWGVTLTGGAY